MYTSIFNSIIAGWKITGGFYFSFLYFYIFGIFLMECLLLGNRGKNSKIKKSHLGTEQKQVKMQLTQEKCMLLVTFYYLELHVEA